MWVRPPRVALEKVMKIGEKLVVQPSVMRDPETGQLKDGFYPECLSLGVTYRVTHVARTMWGTLIKTDRLNQWVNQDWFRPA